MYSMVQRREKEKDSRYIQEASDPAAEPCIRSLTSCTSVTPTLVMLPECLTVIQSRRRPINAIEKAGHQLVLNSQY